MSNENIGQQCTHCGCLIYADSDHYDHVAEAEHPTPLSTQERDMADDVAMEDAWREMDVTSFDTPKGIFFAGFYTADEVSHAIYRVTGMGVGKLGVILRVLAAEHAVNLAAAEEECARGLAGQTKGGDVPPRLEELLSGITPENLHGEVTGIGKSSANETEATAAAKPVTQNRGPATTTSERHRKHLHAGVGEIDALGDDGGNRSNTARQGGIAGNCGAENSEGDNARWHDPQLISGGGREAAKPPNNSAVVEQPTEPLAACPFCGTDCVGVQCQVRSGAFGVPRVVYYVTFCCGQLDDHDAEDAARAEWNRRAAQPQVNIDRCAREIQELIGVSGQFVVIGDIAAIIKRHIEGGKES